MRVDAEMDEVDGVKAASGGDPPLGGNAVILPSVSLASGVLERAEAAPPESAGPGLAGARIAGAELAGPAFGTRTPTGQATAIQAGKGQSVASRASGSQLEAIAFERPQFERFVERALHEAYADALRQPVPSKFKQLLDRLGASKGKG